MRIEWYSIKMHIDSRLFSAQFDIYKISKKEVKTMPNSYTENKLERGDAVYGVVTSRCRKGAYIDLDNGEYAFCVDGACLREGTRIICSVKKPSTDHDRVIVRLDNVCSVFDFDAA